MTDDIDREQGIDFGPLEERLDDAEFPVSVAELRVAWGDLELALVDGSTTLGTALGGLEGQRLESAAEVRETVKNGVGAEAVGRDGYTDRGGIEGETAGRSF